MAAGWRLDGDALDAGGLRVALQRIAIAQWQARGPLRSWGLAPLHHQGDSVCVPCGDDEALWLGAWAEPPGGSGVVVLSEADATQAVHIAVPQQQAVAALADGRPIARHAPLRRRELLLMLTPAGQARPLLVPLALLAPADWSALSGRRWAALAGPPPRPPRLG